MTAHRRPLLLSTAAATFLLPACLSIQAHPTPVTPPEQRDRVAAQAQAKATEVVRKSVTDFGMLPSRPGETVAIHPAGNDAKDNTPAKPTTTAQKPTPSPTADAAAAPSADVNVAGGPGVFPLRPAPLSSSLTDPPILIAVRAYAENRPDKAIEILKALDAPNQELVLALLPILARGATADLAADPVAIAVLAEQLRAAAGRLEPRAALRVENVAFCRKVYGFGRYDPWPQGQPYRPNDQAQLYLEVRNLPSEAAPGPHGETHLTHARAAVEIRDAHGRLVEQPDPEDWRRRVQVVRFETKRFTRGSIQDFHLLYPFAVPTAPGVYTVTVQVSDGSGRRVVRSAPLRFDVAGP